MFNKVVSNLALSPSAVDQLSFYARRLRGEEKIRRTGLILIVISMFIQVFAAMIPPEKSLAASNNDVIAGGVSSIGDLKSKYNSRADVKALYNRFGLDASSMNTTGGVQNTSFNFQEQGSKGSRTVGRINFTYTNDNYLGSFAGSNFYSRNAAEWQGSGGAYYFDKHRGTDGNYYYVWVLKDCGNIAYRRADSSTATAGPPQTTNQLPVPKPVVKPTIALPQSTPAAPTPTPTPTPTPPTPVAPTPPTTEQPPVCAFNPALKPDDEGCKCPDNPSLPASDSKCLPPKQAKQAQNITQKLSPDLTVKTTANPGDVIEYMLVTTNYNSADRQGYLVADYIGDVLDYADLDTEFMKVEGGTYDAATKTIKWENQTIPKKGQLQKSFRVKVKSVIPSTNQPNATAPDYDCKMQNGYGNETVIMVACPVLKTVETLPNTGPGSTIAIAGGVTVFSTFFYMRSRLLSKEVGIIRKTYQAGAQ